MEVRTEKARGIKDTRRPTEIRKDSEIPNHQSKSMVRLDLGPLM